MAIAKRFEIEQDDTFGRRVFLVSRRWWQQCESARDITRLGQPPRRGPADTRSATHPKDGTAA